MGFGLKSEQVIEHAPRLVLAQLVDPRRERRVRIDRLLARDLVRPHDRVVGPELVAAVVRVSARLGPELVPVLARLVAEPVRVVVARQPLEEFLVPGRQGRVRVVVRLPERAARCDKQK